MKTIAFTLLIGLLACQGAKTDKNYSAEANKINKDEIAAAQLEAATTEQIISAYLKMKDALVNTDSEKAAFAAEELLFNFENNNSEFLQKLFKEVRLISETKEVEQQRIYFEGLSNNIYTLAKNSDTEMNLYQQYCPMAFDNTGAYWMSDNEKVYNPYFGDKMLRCGKVTETVE